MFFLSSQSGWPEMPVATQTRESIDLLFKQRDLRNPLASLEKLPFGPSGGGVNRKNTPNLYREVRGLIQEQKWNDAIIEIREAIRKEPGQVLLHVWLADALTRAGQKEEGLRVLFQLLATSQDPALIKKGKPLAAWKRTQEQIQYRIRILSHLFLSNKTFQLYQDGLNLLFAKKYKNARDRFEKALGIEPNHQEILLRLGQCFLMEGDFKKANDYFKAGTKLNPFNPELTRWLGRSHFLKGDLSDAIHELQVSYKACAESELTATWLAEVLSATGKTLQAITLLETQIKKYPGSVFCLITLARLKLQNLNSDGQSNFQTHPRYASQVLWSARKTLQLAMSRIDQYPAFQCDKQQEVEVEESLSKTSLEIKAEIQKLLKQTQTRLESQKIPHSHEKK